MMKGLRPVLAGFVITVHGGMWEVLNVLFARARVHCDIKTRQIGLNCNFAMTFLNIIA